MTRAGVSSNRKMARYSDIQVRRAPFAIAIGGFVIGSSIASAIFVFAANGSFSSTIVTNLVGTFLGLFSVYHGMQALKWREDSRG